MLRSPAATASLLAGALALIPARAAGGGEGVRPQDEAPPPALILQIAPGAKRVEGLIALAPPPGAGGFDPELAGALRAGRGALVGEAPGVFLAAHRAELELREGLGALRIEFACPLEEAAAVLERALALARAPLLAQTGRPADAPSPALRRLVNALAGEPAAGAGEDDSERAAGWHRELDGCRLAAGLSGPQALADQREALEAALEGFPSIAKPPAAPSLSPAAPGNYLLDRPCADAELAVLGAAQDPESADGAALELASAAFADAGRLHALRDALAAERVSAIALGLRFAWHPARPARALAWLRAPAAELGPTLSSALERFGPALRDLGEPEVLSARAKLFAEEPAYGESPRSELARAVLAALHGLDPQRFVDHARRVAALDAGALRSGVERALDPRSRTLLALGPLEPLRPALAPFEPAFARIDPSSDELYDALFEALGGRAAWRAARCVELEVEHTASGRDPSRLRVQRELDSPCMRVESEVGGQPSTFVLNERNAANRVGAQLMEFPEAVHADLVERSWRDVHCLLHQLACAGPRSVRSPGVRRIEIASGPSSGLWIELADDALPARAGTGDTLLFLYSDWKAFGPLVAPARIQLEPKVWSREVLHLVAKDELSAQLFELP